MILKGKDNETLKKNMKKSKLKLLFSIDTLKNVQKWKSLPLRFCFERVFIF